MATVRMSQRLTTEIRNAAKKKFATVHPTIDHVYIDNWFKENIYNKIGKYKDMTNELFGSDVFNYDRMSSLDTVYIYSSYIDEDGDERKVNQQCEFEQGQFEVPYQLANGYSSMSLYLPTENSVVQKIIKTQDHNRAVNRKKDAYLDKIDEALSEFTTLNQALKAWPALKDLVDDEYIQKVHKKVPRAQKQKEQRELIESQEQELNEVLLTANLLEN